MYCERKFYAGSSVLWYVFGSLSPFIFIAVSKYLCTNGLWTVFLWPTDWFSFVSLKLHHKCYEKFIILVYQTNKKQLILFVANATGQLEGQYIFT